MSMLLFEGFELFQTLLPRAGAATLLVLADGPVEADAFQLLDPRIAHRTLPADQLLAIVFPLLLDEGAQLLVLCVAIGDVAVAILFLECHQFVEASLPRHPAGRSRRNHSIHGRDERGRVGVADVHAALLGGVLPVEAETFQHLDSLVGHPRRAAVLATPVLGAAGVDPGAQAGIFRVDVRYSAVSLDLSVLGEPVEVRRPLVCLLRRGKDEANLLQILDLVVGHGGLRSLLPVAVLLPLCFNPPAELLVLVVHSWHEAVAVSFLVGLELLQALGPGVDPPLILLLRGAGATLAGGGFGGAAGPCGFGDLLDDKPLEAILEQKRE